MSIILTSDKEIFIKENSKKLSFLKFLKKIKNYCKKKYDFTQKNNFELKKQFILETRITRKF